MTPEEFATQAKEEMEMLENIMKGGRVPSAVASQETYNIDQDYNNLGKKKEEQEQDPDKFRDDCRF